MKLVKLGQQPKKLYDLRLYVNLYISFEKCNFTQFYSSAEKKLRELTASLNEISKKVEVFQLNLGNYEASKQKLSAENGDLLRQVQELENSANLFMKTKVGLVHALDEMKGVADHEAKERIALLGKFRNLEHNVDGLKDMLSDEALGKENIAHQLDKALGDVDMWRKKYELEGLDKSDELKMANLKLQARLSDSQNMIEQLSQKLVQLDKRKGQLQDEATDMSVMLDQAQVLNSTMEKKAKYGRIVGEWEHKVDGLSMELHIAQNETRNVSAELFKSKMPKKNLFFD